MIGREGNTLSAKSKMSEGEAPGNRGEFLLLENSLGYHVRTTHRLIQRHLAKKIESQGVTLGMWYFLRALWEKDGCTQKELSIAIGTMEPTTLNAIKTMEAAGFVRRLRNEGDRRKINIYLTPRGRELRLILLPQAESVIDKATHGFSNSERLQLLRQLDAIQRNLENELTLPEDTESDLV